MDGKEMYVLYADIMGFKDRVMRTEHSVLEEQFDGLLTDLNAWLVPNQKAQAFKVSFFSDSILIIDENARDGFNRISQSAAGLMQVSLEHQFPIKGAISKGMFTYKEDKQLFFGRAVVDAYLLQEQVHYYGIVAHHSMESDIKRYAKGWKEKKKTKGRNPYVLSPIPLKSGNTTHYHLAYNLISETLSIGISVEIVNKKIISHLEEISATVSGTPRIYVDKTLQVLERDLSIFKKHEETTGGEVIFPISKINGTT